MKGAVYMNNDQLAYRISNLTDEELLRMVNEKAEDYTETALKIAFEEIETRGLQGKSLKEVLSERKEVIARTEQINNGVSSFFKFIGFLGIVLSILSGIILLFNSVFFFYGIGVILSGLLGSSLFIGFGEIINLLHKINEKL